MEFKFLAPFTLALNFVFAGAPVARASTPVGVTSTEHTLTKNGIQTRYMLHRYQNANGELELAVELEEFRPFLPTAYVVVMYGRDLDHDGLIDAWFIPAAAGTLRSVDRASAEADGWDVAQTLLTPVAQKSYLDLIAYAVSDFTMTGNAQHNHLNDLTRQEMDLLDEEISADRLESESPNNSFSKQAYLDIAKGWTQIAVANEQTIVDAYYSTLMDASMLVFGGKALEAAGTWMGPKLLPPQLKIWAAAQAKQIAEGAQSQSVRLLERLKLKGGLSEAAIVGAERAVTVFARSRAGSRALQARLLLEKAARAAVAKATQIGTAGVKEWPYLAISFGTQFAAETYMRRDQVLNSDPYLFLKNVASNRDMLQDIAFQSEDEFMQTGISSADTNVARRMAVCGVVSFFDSMGASVVVKGKPDPERLALDTSWQVVAANIETQIDLGALKYFERLADHSGRPGMKLIGYAIVVMNQGLTFYGYGLATSELEKHQASAKKAKSAADVEATPVLVPIYTN